MPFRFRRSFRIAPGIRLNLGKSGVTASIGVPGANVTLGHGGARATGSVPGTGVSYCRARDRVVESAATGDDAWPEPCPVNPDICAIGGITAMLDIAAMAQPQAVVMAPHNYDSVLMGFAATIQVCAIIPKFRIAEYFVNFVEPCASVAKSMITVKDGWAELPTVPGLGVDVDVERLRKRPFKEFAHKPLTPIADEFPRLNYVARINVDSCRVTNVSLHPNCVKSESDLLMQADWGRPTTLMDMPKN